MEIEVIDNVYLRSSRSRKNRIDIWFIHGFGESSLSFLEAFSSDLSQKYNLYAPDFPGFGASPPFSGDKDLKQSLRIIRKVIEIKSPKSKIVIVAHSLGGIIGTWLARDLGDRVIAYINVEGNLIKNGTSFSSQVSKVPSPIGAHEKLLSLIWEKAVFSSAYQRYCASVRFADPISLKAWAKSGVRYTGFSKSGQEYAALKCNKIYLWGENSISAETRDFVASRRPQNKCIKCSGHWPMIDRAKDFYRILENFISEA